MIGFRRGGHGAVVSRESLLSREDAPDISAPSREVRIERLVGLHFDFVWQLLRRLGLSPSDADDAAQQVFMILARRLDDLEPGRERAFLYGTTRRVLSNLRRAVKRRSETDDVILGEASSGASPPDELLAAARDRAFLDELLAALPDELRRVFVLAELEELAVPEIATLEGIPVGTAASRLRRARAVFRDVLAAAHAQKRLGAASE